MRENRMERTFKWLGNDLVICVYNQNAHIGSIVTGQPYIKENEVHVTLNTWNQLGHKDDIIATMYVKAAVKKYRCVVSCICGIHLDNITDAQMQAIFDWVQEDIKTLS